MSGLAQRLGAQIVLLGAQQIAGRLRLLAELQD